MPPISRDHQPSGTRIGQDWVLGSEIGKGSFATVYRARHKHDGALVAIKSVTRSKLNKKLMENLRLEIDILRELKHPHIVALIDFVEADIFIHLIMDYCEMKDLAHFLKRKQSSESDPYVLDILQRYPGPAGGGLNEVLTRHFLKQLASALKFLRTKQLVHRDVKPQNLLITLAPSYRQTMEDAPLIYKTPESTLALQGVESLPVLKLADFGFARTLPSTSLAATLCGSPLYMAPEILRYEQYDAKADLWSVGSVLYEMTCGKPHFRANNHVELAHKIEVGKDVIKFTLTACASPPLKALIRALLKRHPVERISFDDFFSHEVIVEDIPGLIGADRPKPTIEHETSRRRLSGRVPSRQSTSDSIGKAPAPQMSSSPRSDQRLLQERSSSSRQVSGTSPRLPSTLAQPPAVSEATQDVVRRPGIRPAATEPLLHVQQLGPEAQAMLREVSQDTASPGSSLLTGVPSRQQRGDAKSQSARRVPSQQDVAAKAAAREVSAKQIAEEIQFERDYVVVEKRVVEVNSFADAMAAETRSRAVTNAPLHARTGALTRRATTQGTPTSLTGAVPPNPSTALQVRENRPEHERRPSFERRYAPTSSPTLTSQISKALGAASLRLVGFGMEKFSPTLLGKGASPPLYNPFPSYQMHMNTNQLGETKSSTPQDSDSRAVSTIEDAASRSDIVYGFAEVKYRQLIPMAPSMMHGIGGGLASGGVEAEDREDGLTPDAVVILSEEALVLYVKSLSLLAKVLEHAATWWAKRNQGEITTGKSSPRNGPSRELIGGRINAAVQWTRNRFNEVLEKAEFVRLKLIEAQKQLPLDHPGHPSNHKIPADRDHQGGTGDVVLTNGTTAEALMYARALEMSQDAAIRELSNDDLPGCELSYTTAIRMLEAVLEDDDNLQQKPVTGVGSKDLVNGIVKKDQEDVQKVLTMVHQRLQMLRKKIAHFARMQQPPNSLPARLSGRTQSISGDSNIGVAGASHK